MLGVLIASTVNYDGGSLNTQPISAGDVIPPKQKKTGLSRRELRKFTLKEILKRINAINININLKHSKPFPKERSRLISFYEYRKRQIRFKKGRLPGGELRILISLVDFTFVRSLVADRYSNEGGHCHDPVTVMLLELFARYEGMDIKKFVKIVNNETKSGKYHDYAGLPPGTRISGGTFTNVRKQIGEERYDRILHILVQIMTELEFITGEIISVDCTLTPAYSRYKKCTHACEKCRCMECEGVLQKIKERVEAICSGQDNNLVGKENRVFVECPNPAVEPPKGKTSKVSTEVICFTVEKGKSNKAGDTLAENTGMAEILSKQGLGLNIKRSNIAKFHPDNKDIVFINCCRIPSDIDAGLGCRRSKDDPNKKEWVFGFNAIIAVATDPILGLELPVAVITIPGNGDECGELIPLMEQIDRHSFKTKVYVADSRYDKIDNYDAVRERGAVPLIDYNPRNENQDEEALMKRGYDENGWPYAPCEVLMRPNGFDSNAKRVKFCCFRECAKEFSSTECSRCPHFKNKMGHTKNMSIKKHPRLILEIPRGSKKYKKTYNHRTASERINSYLKDKCDLRRPLIRGLKNFRLKVIIACIVTLLMKVIGFILEVTYLFNSEGKCTSTAGKTAFEDEIGNVSEEGIACGIP